MSIHSMLIRANHSIQIQRRSNDVSDLGGKNNVKWIPLKTINPCWVQPARADTKYQYKRRDEYVTHSVYFDRDPTVTINDRFLFNDKLFQIKGVRNEAELGRLWVIDALSN